MLKQRTGSPNTDPMTLLLPGKARCCHLLLLFLNPLAIVLLIAAVFSAFLGQAVDATIIVLVVILGNAINFWQTYRSQRAIERLRETVTSTASVLRDGDWKEIPRREIVPGDIVRVFAGDLVPADARLMNRKTYMSKRRPLPGSHFRWKRRSLDRTGNRSARSDAHGFPGHIGCQRISARGSECDRSEDCLRRDHGAIGCTSGRERV